MGAGSDSVEEASKLTIADFFPNGFKIRVSLAGRKEHLSEKRVFYVYVHRDSKNNIFYVGKEWHIVKDPQRP